MNVCLTINDIKDHILLKATSNTGMFKGLTLYSVYKL